MQNNKQTTAMSMVPGLKNMTHIHTHPTKAVLLFWFDCDSPGLNVVCFPYGETFLFLMDDNGSKVFVDPTENEDLQFVCFPTAAMPGASVELADIIADNFDEIVGGAA